MRTSNLIARGAYTIATGGCAKPRGEISGNYGRRPVLLGGMIVAADFAMTDALHPPAADASNAAMVEVAVTMIEMRRWLEVRGLSKPGKTWPQVGIGLRLEEGEVRLKPTGENETRVEVYDPRRGCVGVELAQDYGSADALADQVEAILRRAFGS